MGVGRLCPWILNNEQHAHFILVFRAHQLPAHSPLHTSQGQGYYFGCVETEKTSIFSTFENERSIFCLFDVVYNLLYTIVRVIPKKKYCIHSCRFSFLPRTTRDIDTLKILPSINTYFVVWCRAGIWFRFLPLLCQAI